LEFAKGKKNAILREGWFGNSVERNQALIVAEFDGPSQLKV